MAKTQDPHLQASQHSGGGSRSPGALDGDDGRSAHHGAEHHADDAKVRDPVCGMSVNPAQSQHRFDHDGQTRHFCSAGCRTKFAADPDRYLNRSNEAGSVPDGAIFICPMHPQIRQAGPGSCPICGMALEPELATLDAPPNPELADMTRRFWVGLVLSLPVVILEMGGHLVRGYGWLDQTAANWIQLVFATPVVLWAGWPFFVRAWHSLLSRNLNMFTLIAMGTGVSYLYSIAGTLTPASFPASFRGHGGAVAVYFEAAAVITVLVLLGQVLELRAREATSGAIKALLELAPKTARRIAHDGTEHEVPIDSIVAGDRLRVRPGEKIPVDGIILEGRSSIDESLVTGESMPVTKEAGSKVLAGTLNRSGGFIIRADKVGRDTLLSQIVKMVTEAQRSRAPIQRLADQVASWFVPAVIAIALLAFGIWAYFGPEPRLSYGLLAAVSVLIIACPCALGLATPMSIMGGIGRGAQAGVLIKNAEALERMERIDTLVVDKTGTLTEGKPAVTAVVAAEGFSEAEILRLAASVERASEHPLATAIVKAAEARGIVIAPVAGFESPTGKGALGTVEARKVVLGNAAFMREQGVDPASLEEAAEALRQDGATAIFIGVDGRAAGAIAIADPIKASTPEALAGLMAEGVRVMMLTGDNWTTAKAVARRRGIEELEAEVLPDRKGAVVKRHRDAGRAVAIAGDGVNDAPALAAADVGIAMGTGTDIAMESAGVTLVKGDLTGIL